MIAFIVRAGNAGRIVHANGEIAEWFVRKDLTFSSEERVNHPSLSKDEIAFHRKGYILILRKNHVRIPDEVKEVIRLGLKTLAGVCDGALKHDTVGFSGTDSRYGHILASAPFLSTKMLLDGAKILPKYHRQLPPEVVELARNLGPKKFEESRA